VAASVPEVAQMRRFIIALAAAAASAAAGYQLVYKPWRRQWYASRDEAARPLPGDDLVPDADFNETMAITIDASPSTVWPWLLQVGYGRGGWYSYDVIDMRGHSAREIRPELQDLQVGQMVPFAPGMGFRVDVLEPERALVLYGDDSVSAQQAPATGEEGAGGPVEEQGAGLKMTGVLAQANMSAFAVSWAFVLEPLDGGRTRLLERFRTRTTPGPAASIVGPLIGHGHFLMTRKQMLGIKERAEMLAGTAGRDRAGGRSASAGERPQEVGR
jgi:hypothetical protein